MSDIREQLKSIVFDVYVGGDTGVSVSNCVDNAVDKLVSLFPVGWQSFSEEKPKVLKEVLVKSKSGEVSFTWFDSIDEITEYECLGYQWLRIPE